MFSTCLLSRVVHILLITLLLFVFLYAVLHALKQLHVLRVLLVYIVLLSDRLPELDYICGIWLFECKKHRECLWWGKIELIHDSLQIVHFTISHLLLDSTELDLFKFRFDICFNLLTQVGQYLYFLLVP